jgi:hypothetical protein
VGVGLKAFVVAATLCALTSETAVAATFVIVNGDDAGEGFNDQTSTTPVGGNDGTTLGEQRLIALEHAVQIWAESLRSTVAI